MTEPDWDDNEYVKPKRPVADIDGVRVMRTMCKTCIFRPGNKMQLQEGRVEGMVNECLEKQGTITCHSTLDEDTHAICKGFYDRYADDIWPLRFAKGIGAIIEHEIE